MNKIKNILRLVLLSSITLACEAQEQKDMPPCPEQIRWAKKTTAERVALETRRYVIDSLKALYDKQDTSAKQLRSETDNIKSLIKHTSSFAWRFKFKGKSYDTYIVNTANNQIRLFNKTEKGTTYTFKTILKEVKQKQSRLAFAMNAGMFKADRSPEGLYIENGVRKSKLAKYTKDQRKGNFYAFPHNKNHKYGSGIFIIKKDKTTAIIPTDTYEKTIKNKDVLLGTQSGPIALYKGEINQYFNENSSNKNIRNGVGIINNKKVVFLISNEPVNLYEFAQVFREVFGCQTALYLDGVVSKHYLPDLHRTDTRMNVPLGTFITVIK